METKLEINKRRADERLTKLERDLKKQGKVRQEQRKQTTQQRYLKFFTRRVHQRR